MKMALQEAGCGNMEWIDLADIGTVGGHLWVR